ncbi:MAG: NeuD/PglB/VioB family sugar acetyltransferase [Candidatus Amulumruptor caecigallinarius]|nr:NeuD/PglB/VioB family sugar acetyltransferase [Candidatus Amulumruptor caecigallinarius]MCM1397734.1 NeuD/PglB/VioB family sugar acetyltransferase [Candidatus Amulumruptor caecigallinarius]MCM1454616.1 NeuD/PglB/VioB family sugar acetyltransferase [bacterium]
MSRPLVLIGNGGHCRSVIDAALSAGLKISHITGFPDDPGKPVMGAYICDATDADIPRLAADHDFVIAFGGIKDMTPRRRVHEFVEEAGGRLATVVASTAWVSPYATVGRGTVVLHHATVCAGATLGESVIINTAASVDHDATVGAYSHISTGARINGGASVGELCMVGSNAVVLQGISIAPRTVIGAGAVVTHSITEPGIYAGTPARLIHPL